MERTQLLQHFDTLAETPEAVVKLRRFILDLAVHGRLLESSSQKSVEKQNLGSVIQLISGQHLTPEDYNEDGEGIPYLTGPADFGPRFPKASRWTTTPKVTASKGDILLTVKGAGVGKTNVVIVKEMAISRQLMAVRPKGIDADFVELSLRAAFAAFQAASNGIAIPGISRNDVLKHDIWVPPLAEQRRIVAKVEELLALCDELEAQQTAAREHRTRLVRSALDHLTTAQDESDFKKHSAFCLQHSELVFDSVPAVRQTILSLAGEGRLVPQKSAETANGLLLKVQAQKKRLENKGVIKKPKPLPPIEKEELEHMIPDSWVWARLGDICELITDGTHLTPKNTEKGRMFLSAQNVKPFRFIPDKHRFVSEADCQGYIKNRKPEFGDILLTRVGAGIGEAAVIDQRLDFAIYVSIALVRPAKGLIDPRYMTLWLNSPHGTGKSRRFTYGVGMSQGNLNLGQIQKFVVPIPSLAEQQRIVAKVDELLRWCDALEARLTAARTTATHLLDATLHQILAA